LEALDEAWKAREHLATDGAVFVDRFGQQKPSPWVDVADKSRAAWLRCIRELGIDLAEAADDPRPPQIAAASRRGA
jgi:hypothetical protein